MQHIFFTFFFDRLRTDDDYGENDQHEEGQRVQIGAVIWKEFEEGTFTMGRVTTYMEHEDW